MIKFIGTDLLSRNVEFNFEEIGAIYSGDDTVYIHENPVRISSVEVKTEKPQYNNRSNIGGLKKCLVVEKDSLKNL